MFIAGNLEAVMATEGYKHLTASWRCPSVMDDLLMAVHGRKN
jgi:speckle-type POZ protein